MLAVVGVGFVFVGCAWDFIEKEKETPPSPQLKLPQSPTKEEEHDDSHS